MKDMLLKIFSLCVKCEEFRKKAPSYVIPLGLSAATVGVLFLLKKFNIIYQLFHKVTALFFDEHLKVRCAQ